MIPNLVFDFLASNAVVGFVAGAALTCWSGAIKGEVVLGWRTFCAFAHRMHVKQTTLDDRAIDLIDKARPAINAALDEARNGLVVERSTAAAIDADTVQNGSLAPKPVDAAPLPAPAVVAAVAVAP